MRGAATGITARGVQLVEGGVAVVESRERGGEGLLRYHVTKPTARPRRLTRPPVASAFASFLRECGVRVPHERRLPRLRSRQEREITNEEIDNAVAQGSCPRSPSRSGVECQRGVGVHQIDASFGMRGTPEPFSPYTSKTLGAGMS